MSSNSALAEASSLIFAARSTLVCEEVWLELSQVAFDVVLDGFSKVRKVSPEGRSAMIKDVGALEEGLSAVHLCHAPRGRDHVVAYCSAASLGDEEILNWMRNNYQAYSYRHLHNLASQAFSSVMVAPFNSSKRFKEAVSMLDELYHDTDKNPSKLAQLFPHGGELNVGGAGGKISGAVSTMLHSIGAGKRM